MKNYTNMVPVKFLDKVGLLFTKEKDVQSKLNKIAHNIGYLFFFGSTMVVFSIILNDYTTVPSIITNLSLGGVLGSFLLVILVSILEKPINNYYKKQLGYNYIINELEDYLKLSTNQKEIITYFNELRLSHPTLSETNDLFKIAIMEKDYSEAISKITILVEKIKEIDKIGDQIESTRMKVLELEKSLGLVNEVELELNNSLKKYL